MSPHSGTTSPTGLPHNAAGQFGAARFEALAVDLKAELIQAAERGQVRAGEGSVKHVEIYLLAA